MSGKQLDTQQQLDQVKQPLPVIYPSSTVLVQNEHASEKDTFALHRVVAFDARIVRVRDWNGQNEQDVSWDRLRLIDLVKFKKDVSNGTTGLGFSAGDPVLALWRENKAVPFQLQYKNGFYYPPTKLTTDKVDISGQCCVVYERSFQQTHDLWTLRNSCGNCPCKIDFPSISLPVALRNVQIDARMMAEAMDYLAEYTKIWENARAEEKGRLIAQAEQKGAGKEQHELWKGAIVTSARAAQEDDTVEAALRKKAVEQKHKFFHSQALILQQFPNLVPSTPFIREPVHLSKGSELVPGVFEGIYAEIQALYASVFLPLDKRQQDLYISSLAECLALKQPLVASIPEWMPLLPDSRSNPVVRLWSEQVLPPRVRASPAKGLFETAESMVAGIATNNHNNVFSSVCHRTVSSQVLKHTSSFTQHVAFCGRLGAEMREKAKSTLKSKLPTYKWTSLTEFLQDTPVPDVPSKHNPIYIPYAHPLVPLPSLTTLIAVGPSTHRDAAETGILFNQSHASAFAPVDVMSILKPLPHPETTKDTKTESRLVVKKRKGDELINSRIAFKTVNGKVTQFKHSSTTGSAVAAPYVTIF